MNRCIFCWIEFLNNKKGIVDPNLMKLCPVCRKVNSPSRFKMSDALSDPTSKVHAGTCTLKPTLHKYPPHIVWDVYKKIIKCGFQNRKKACYIEAYPEFTASGVLHMHFYACGPSHALGHVYASFRRLGFCLIKQVFSSEDWLSYCRKDQDPDNELQPIIYCN